MSYYRLLNEFCARDRGAWQQPQLLIDSVNFREIVDLQRRDDWVGTGRIMADSARRLQVGGADVLAIGANTMHINMPEVRAAVSIPVVDVRDALVHEVRALGGSSVSLLGTRYLIEKDFYAGYLEEAGLRVVKPTADQVDELHEIIFTELTQGVVTPTSRERFVQIADDCHARGGEVVGLCCTEFGLFLGEADAPWPMVDSTVAHVKALLRA